NKTSSPARRSASARIQCGNGGGGDDGERGWNRHAAACLCLFVVDSAHECCNNYNTQMKAILIQKERIALSSGFVEVVIWHLPALSQGSAHPFKYRLACVIDEVCMLRYDNETGKGDHKHVNGREVAYAFTTLDQLVDDFWADVALLGD
ncbi:MAG: DUF6516 family protein, partial [Burkholderiaceae bacterium]|nr:DUF6516 family protein [Burkholderiaceae bacterium]